MNPVDITQNGLYFTSSTPQHQLLGYTFCLTFSFSFSFSSFFCETCLSLQFMLFCLSHSVLKVKSLLCSFSFGRCPVNCRVRLWLQYVVEKCVCVCVCGCFCGLNVTFCFVNPPWIYRFRALVVCTLAGEQLRVALV